jgi:DNA-binding protein Fis
VKLELSDSNFQFMSSSEKSGTQNAAITDSVRMFIDHFVTAFVSSKSPVEDLDGLHPLIIGSMENHLIVSVLKKCRGNKLRAARVLGLHRNTLAQKLALISGAKPVKKGVSRLGNNRRLVRGRKPRIQA